MRWKTKGRLAGMALLACSFVSANGAMVFGSAAASDPIVQNISFSPSVTTAEITARQQFHRLLTHTNTAQSDAAVKIAVTTDDGPQVIWVNRILTTGDHLVGRLVKTSMPLRRATGDAVAFTPDQVLDWTMTAQNGKLFGNFTARALLPSLSLDQSTAIAAALTTNPVPASW